MKKEKITFMKMTRHKLNRIKDVHQCDISRVSSSELSVTMTRHKLSKDMDVVPSVTPEVLGEVTFS